ncbi:MAG: cobalt ECF transporter T component CbiQ [Tissierellia bacterium]|nr:cobalt ECF transporter T component CbiQ [Tissierellia bacterium]
MLIIDKYAYSNRLADSDPFLKFIVVVIALAITTTIRSIYINIMIFAMMSFMTTKVAGIPLDKYFRILSIPMGFLLISTITILVSVSKIDIFVYSINMFDYYIGITISSMEESIYIVTRVVASMGAAFFLGLTTPLNNLVKVFRKLHLPKSIIELIVLIYRSIFIFLEEAQEIHTGQELKFGYSNFKNSLRSTGLLLRSLFLRVLLRYKEMVIILECKLYDGEFKTGD